MPYLSSLGFFEASSATGRVTIERGGLLSSQIRLGRLNQGENITHEVCIEALDFEPTVEVDLGILSEVLCFLHECISAKHLVLYLLRLSLEVLNIEILLLQGLIDFFILNFNFMKRCLLLFDLG